MIEAKNTHETIENLSSLLREDDRCFFSRFGDGDVFIMDGKDQANHHFSEALQREMIESFRIEHPAYMKALSINYPKEKFMCRGCFAPYGYNDYLEKVVCTILKEKSAYQFENPVVFHYLSIFYPHLMNEFFDEFFRGKKIMFIGGLKVDAVEKVLGQNILHIKTPLRDAYSSIEQWWPEVINKIDDVDIVIPSAGMASRVINKRLWMLENDTRSIDIGSIFDAVAGLKSRTWIQLAGHRLEEIILPEYRSKSKLIKFRNVLLDLRFKIKRLRR